MHTESEIAFIAIIIVIAIVFAFGLMQYSKAETQNEFIQKESNAEKDLTSHDVDKASVIENREIPTFRVKSFPKTPGGVIGEEGGNPVGEDYTKIGENSSLIITIEFTRPVDSASLSDSNVLLKTERSGYADISIVPSDEKVVITTNKPYVDLCDFNDCQFDLILIGEGSNKLKPISDTKGMALDGDEDGIPGGDYKTTFVMKR